MFARPVGDIASIWSFAKRMRNPTGSPTTAVPGTKTGTGMFAFVPVGTKAKGENASPGPNVPLLSKSI